LPNLLIISPYFPPANAADMHRIRTSLPYFKQFGWSAEVVSVNPEYMDIATDELLSQSISGDTRVHYVKALNKKWTSKIGLGSIALRSLWYYYKKVNQLFEKQKFDLVYFSTTQFPVCVLGAYWKKRFNIPYVIDMQDPWHSEYYRDKPRAQRPAKYWFSYRLNKYLEPIAMRHVDGLISVSEIYITDLKNRYPQIKNIQATTITFGAFKPDMEIAASNAGSFTSLLTPGFKNIVYIGRGGADMHRAIAPVFKVLKQGFGSMPDVFSKLRLYFIGTSYAPQGAGKFTILPLAQKYGVENAVVEITDRIGFYHALATLQNADALFIPGSDDPKYSASKIYPYILTGNPILAIFNADSPARDILKEFGVKHNYSYDKKQETVKHITDFLTRLSNGEKLNDNYNEEAMAKYSALNTTAQQCELFDAVINRKS
jgi:hypothetical protein